MARMFFRRGFLAACAGLGLWLGFATMQAAAQQYPQQQDPQQQGPAPADVARMSFVQGSVQIASGGETEFQPAVVNMPLFDGTRVQTGQDGQAEIAFNDGSVARLTPNSSLQLDRLGQDGVQMQQLSGLAYYELNVGQDHPPFQVGFQNAWVAPTDNAIFRMDLDNIPDVAVMTGSVQVSGDGLPTADVEENESLSFAPNGNAPYTVAQSFEANSWDQWNQDRDQEISQEAAQQTTARDDSANPGDENWNDLDYYGNWYPVEGAGNVWVPDGVGAGWDPYGYGYWGYYPTYGSVWISGYPWGWLPYHCGAWNYYSFGWGWAPGGCGRTWMPIGGIRGYPGYVLPARPVWHYRPGTRLPSRRIVAVDRGARARGPWGSGHAVPRANPRATLHVNGRAVDPIGRTAFTSQAFAGNRGTTPGMRSMLDRVPGSRQPRVVNQPQTGRSPTPNVNAQRFPANRPPIEQNRPQQARPPMQRARPPIEVNRPQQVQPPMQQARPPMQQPRPPMQQARPPMQQIRPQSQPRYMPRATPTPHYSAPPRYSAPTRAAAPRGGGGPRGRR